MSNANWLTIKNAAGSDPAELIIFGDIGDDLFDKSGTFAGQFDAALKAIPREQPVKVRIHSRGGNVWDSFSIATMIMNRGNVTTQCDGIAASSAAVIFQSGQKRIMPGHAMQMVHNSSALCAGGAEEMRKMAEMLEMHDAVLAEYFAKRTGRTMPDCKAMMDAETWMSGEQSKEAGFCDEVIDTAPVQNTFDFSQFRAVPDSLRPPTNRAADRGSDNRQEPMNANPAATPPAAPTNQTPPDVTNLTSQIASIQARLDAERTQRITNVVNGLVTECRLTAAEAPKAITRALADESYLDELSARPAVLPGNTPVASVSFPAVVGEVGTVIKALQENTKTGPASYDGCVERGAKVGQIWVENRAKLLPVFNTATNTISSDLKRTAILQETIRAFALRVLPLRLLSTVFGNVPLQGDGTVTVPYYPLNTDASSTFSTGYSFSGTLTTSSKKITVGTRKYKTVDYTSADFRDQPFFNPARLGAIAAERLGYDCLVDILGVVTSSAYGAAVKTVAVASINGEDVVDVEGACDSAHWPDMGRALIVDSTVKTSLEKDPDFRLALNLGTASVIQNGQFPKISNFELAWMPSLPSNSENLIGFATYASAILTAFSPVDPAPGVRSQLLAYQVVSDPGTGISFNYRHWGDADNDIDREVIEVRFGKLAGEAAALKRICSPA